MKEQVHVQFAPTYYLLVGEFGYQKHSVLHQRGAGAVKKIVEDHIFNITGTCITFSLSDT
jgi:hypothetical protein